MLNYSGMEKKQTEKLSYLPDVNILLKISLGLILFTIISTALVYAETLSIDVDGKSFDVDYTATGMTVSGVEPDSGFGSLLFTIEVTDSSGTLEIVLERSFLDSTFEGEDDPFIVINQFGEDLTFTETTTLQSRTLNIELPAGTVEVDIIGTSFNNPVPVSPEESEPEPEITCPSGQEVNEKGECKWIDTRPEPTPTPIPTPTPTPVDDTPKTQCGPGTVLKAGECVLDQRCGPGTVLEGDVCVLVESTPVSETSVKGLGKDLVTGVIAAIVVAGIVAVILGIMAKASKSSN